MDKELTEQVKQQRPEITAEALAEKKVVKNNPPYELFAKLQLRREQLIGELQMVEQQMNNVRAQIQKVLVENRQNG